jgi:integrase
MAKHVNEGLKDDDWPADDRVMFENLVAKGAVEDGPWCGLSTTTQRNRRYSYGHWLGFLAKEHPEALTLPPAARVTRQTVKQYVLAMRRNCTETTIGHELNRLYLTVVAAKPDEDWRWLSGLVARIRKRAIPLPKPYALSVDLYTLGLDLMKEARNQAALFERVVLAQAEKFRDGLMIAMLAEAPMRRDGFSKLCLNDNFVKIGGRWRIYLLPELVKTKMRENFEISVELSSCVDEYVAIYRPAFPNANAHNGMWPYLDRPMTDKMVRRYVSKHTERRLGTAISPHGFRRGAASFIAKADPSNIRVAKDLLQHHTFSITEQHYIHGANSRRAGQTLAQVIAKKAANQVGEG